MKSGEGKVMLVLCERINQTSQGRIWQSPAPRFGGMLRRCEVLIVLSGTAMPSFCPREGFYTSLAFPIIREMYAMGRNSGELLMRWESLAVLLGFGGYLWCSL